MLSALGRVCYNACDTKSFSVKTQTTLAGFLAGNRFNPYQALIAPADKAKPHAVSCERRMRYRIVTLAVLVLLASTIFVAARLRSAAASGAASGGEPQRVRSGQRRRAPSGATRRPAIDYSKFSHGVTPHRALACDECHTIPTPNWREARKGEAFPDVTEYPDHPSCVRCHRQQFFSGARPVICAVCHTNVSPRNGNRFAFANPRENVQNAMRKPRAASQFAVRFPHDKHQDVMALFVRPSFHFDGAASLVRATFEPQEKQIVDHCTICHQTYEPQGESDEKLMANRPAKIDEADWPKKGTFKTSPTSHASCFNCHWQEGGVAPLSSNCAGCHQFRQRGADIDAQRKHGDANPEVAKAITDEDIREKYLNRQSVKFRHEVTKHITDRGCTSCHIQITTLTAVTATTLDVPILTCAGCHIGNKKVLNLEVEKRRKSEAGKPFQCVKCHETAGANTIPKSHNDAVPLPKSK